MKKSIVLLLPFPPFLFLPFFTTPLLPVTIPSCLLSIRRLSLPSSPKGGLCFYRVAKLSGAHRRLPGEEPLPGHFPIPLGLHLQMDQRLLHGSNWRCLLPQVTSSHPPSHARRVTLWSQRAEDRSLLCTVMENSDEKC